jgi:hypothetical protein
VPREVHAQKFPLEAEGFQAAHPGALDHQVGTLEECLKLRQVAGRRVDDDTAFIAVEMSEHACSAPQRITSWWLHLDDLSTEIRKYFPAVRTSWFLREFHYLKVTQQLIHNKSTILARFLPIRVPPRPL